MAVPDFQSFFYPFLEFSTDGKEHSIAEVRNHVADYFSLSEDDKAERIPSGKQTKLENRIYWTKSYFDKAELIHSTRWGHFQISELGMKYYESCNGNITIANLKEIPKFREFHQGSNSSVTDKKEMENASTDSSLIEDKTPLERLEEAHGFIQKELAEGLLDKIKSNSWQFFEDLVIDLMIAMGYGGSRNKAGQSMKRTNDEGIDGIINEDKLGLDVIYLQAKKWTKEGGIGRPEIQKFVGALHGQRAKKGVFITTSYFTNTAEEYVRTIDPKVILIDGQTLAELMIEYGLGTTMIGSYHIKKIDLDYFEQ